MSKSETNALKESRVANGNHLGTGNVKIESSDKRRYQVFFEACDPGNTYWAKIVPAEAQLPLPSMVHDPEHLPGSFVRCMAELQQGEALLEGEGVETELGIQWHHIVTFFSYDGFVIQFRSDFNNATQECADLEMSQQMLAGETDFAGAVRVIHALRKGFPLSRCCTKPAVEYLVD